MLISSVKLYSVYFFINKNNNIYIVVSTYYYTGKVKLLKVGEKND